MRLLVVQWSFLFVVAAAKAHPHFGRTIWLQVELLCSYREQAPQILIIILLTFLRTTLLVLGRSFHLLCCVHHSDHGSNLNSIIL